MGRYRVRKVHSCEHCGTEETSLGTFDGRADAERAAAADAHAPLRWERCAADTAWPLVADPQDGVWRYVMDELTDGR